MTKRTGLRLASAYDEASSVRGPFLAGGHTPAVETVPTTKNPAAASRLVPPTRLIGSRTAGFFGTILTRLAART
jgi:hypothetical protein